MKKIKLQIVTFFGAITLLGMGIRSEAANPKIDPAVRQILSSYDSEAVSTGADEMKALDGTKWSCFIYPAFGKKIEAPETKNISFSYKGWNSQCE